MDLKVKESRYDYSGLETELVAFYEAQAHYLRTFLEGRSFLETEGAHPLA